MASGFNPRTPCGVRRGQLQQPFQHPEFQSTHSLRSATRCRKTFISGTGFQSTHSLRSATIGNRPARFALKVSIHALLAECDIQNKKLVDNLASFNPRTPCGVRPASVSRNVLISAFQSTHSLRSATRIIALLSLSFNGVSIHALLAECDGQPRNNKPNNDSFNPRTPCGVRRRLPIPPLTPPEFQSTHSLRSATLRIRNLRFCHTVSIHALLAECDATDFIHYYSTEQIILCANLPKKTVIARLHFLSIYLSIFYSQCITPIADLPGNSCELEVGAQAMFHSL